MATINQILNKAKKFERGWKRKLAQTLRDNRKLVLDLQKSQLLSGQDANGKQLTPTYSSDPFFKTPAAAERYKQRKEKKEPQHEGLKRYDIFGRKGSDTPNLIYTGKYHKSLRADIAEDALRIHGTWSKAPNIERKYPTATGLNKTSFKYIWENYAKPDLIDYWNNLK